MPVTMLGHDLRHAWRSLRRTPVVTAAAILTLALGVGATTAIFSVVHASLLRPLPYPEPDRLVEIFEDNRQAGGAYFRASALNYLSWTERARSFDAIGAFSNTAVTLTGDGDPQLLGGSRVTASFFRALGVSPIAGRSLLSDDEQRGSPRVVVIGESLWRSRFGADLQIVGRTITLDGERHQVVGVMPRAFREVGRTQAAGTGQALLFLPMPIDPAQENRGNHTLRVVARLGPGVSLEQARDELGAVAAAMEREFPATNGNWGVRLERVSNTMLDPQVQRSLLLVLGAVAMVFLIACANVANLLLARGTGRETELAVRSALGAARSRLVRQLLIESGCLAVASGAAGVLAAAIGLPALGASLPPTVPRLDEMRLDLSVLAFGVIISIVSGLVFGIVPALRATRLDLSQSLVGIGRTTMDRSRAAVRHALVVAQTALATMLLVTAALLLQGFVRLQNVPLGFEPAGVLTVRLSLPRSAYPDLLRVGQFYGQLLATLQASGEVRQAAVGTSAPFAPGVRASFQPLVRGQTPTGGSTGGAAEHIVSGDYFRLLGVPLLAGRPFNQQDGAGSPGVAIVSQRLARMLWPDTNALGRTFERAGRSYEVVGVVGDIRGSDTQGARGGGLDREPRAAAYFAASQSPQRTMTVLVRPTTGGPNSVIAGIRDAVGQLDRTLAIQDVRPLHDWIGDSVAPTRLTTTVAAFFAASALLLTAIGIYGVLAYTVASRTREIGVRMAMGATRRRVIGLVLRQGMIWAGSGIVVGLAGAFAAARLIATLLFEISARDLATFATVGGAVAIVALMACSFPAARAVRIDPTTAMRTE